MIHLASSNETKTELLNTATDIAVQYGHLELLKVLYQNGCDLSITDDLNFGLVHEAAQGGHTHILRWLSEQKVDLHSETNSGRNAMYYAVSGQASLVTVEYLYTQGFDVDIELSDSTIDSEARLNGGTLMHAAMYNVSHGLDIAKWLFASPNDTHKKTKSIFKFQRTKC